MTPLLALLALAVLVLAVSLVGTRRALARERREREESARLALLGRAGAGFVHDLRNGLMVVQGFADLARKAASAPGTAPKLTSLVNEVADQSQRVTAELNAYLRLARGERETDPLVPIGTILARTIALAKPIAHEKDRTIEADLPELPAPALREAGLRAVLLNLLLNAVDHAAAVVRVRVDSTDAVLRIHIDDDGPGIPEDVARQLFEPFTPGSRGTGLGLANAREAVRAWGGDVTYVRESGVTRFTVRLPLTVQV